MSVFVRLEQHRCTESQERGGLRLGALRALVFALALPACQETPLVAPRPTVIAVSDSAPTFGIADTVSFVVSVTDAVGRPLDPALWPTLIQSLSPDVVQVVGSQLIGRASGSADIVIRAGALTRTVTATVLPAQLFLFRDSAGVEVTMRTPPDTLTLVRGDSLRLRARVHSVPTRDLTSLFLPAWTVSDPTALELSAGLAPQVFVRALDLGSLFITVDVGFERVRIPIIVVSP